MNAQKVEDVKDTALKLDEIRACHPEDYFYLKGWIHCLLQKQNEKNRQPRKPPMEVPMEAPKADNSITTISS